MDIHSFSGAATVALGSTAIFLVISKSWQALTRVFSLEPNFADSIMTESAQRFRDEFDRLTAAQTTYLAAGLVFTVLFVAAHVLDARRLFDGYPVWQLNLFITALVGAGVLTCHAFGKTMLARQRVRLLRDANIAIGHQLQQISTGFGRVYHDIQTSAGMIDHLIIGQFGTYAINVFTHRSRDAGNVEVDGSQLVFNPDGFRLPVTDTTAKISAIEQEFEHLLGHPIRVRSVLAVPGWDVTSQLSEEHLVVNDQRLPMLRGWKDRADYLMHEEVDALCGLLNERCGITNR
jgi:hypothetical protein